MKIVGPVRAWTAWTLLVSIALLGACTADQPGPDAAPGSADGQLVAALDLPSERSLRFYEPEPGTVVTTEVGPIASRTSDPAEQDLNPVELYEHLSGVPAPEALRAAYARAQPEEGAAGAHGESASGTSEPVLLAAAENWGSSSPITREAFREQFCRETDRNYMYLDTHGDSWVRTKGTNYFKTGVYVARGRQTVMFRVHRWDCSFARQCDLNPNPDFGSLTDQERRDPYNFQVGPFRFASARIDCKNCTVEATVTEAEGDTYDFCTNYHY